MMMKIVVVIMMMFPSKDVPSEGDDLPAPLTQSASPAAQFTALHCTLTADHSGCWFFLETILQRERVRDTESEIANQEYTSARCEREAPYKKSAHEKRIVIVAKRLLLQTTTQSHIDGSGEGKEGKGRGRSVSA